MKKTIALLLALITMLTLTLASCSKENEGEEDLGGDFEFNFENNGTGKSTGATDESGNAINANEFITASGTSYILHPVKVREKAKNNAQTIGTAEWGAAVELIERNNTWTKIKFTDTASGATLEGYVRNELLTGDKKAVTKVDLEAAVEATIVNLGKKTDGTSITLNVRTTPWNSSESTEYKNINVLANISNKKYSVQDGDKVEKLATTEDGKWVYIKFTKSVDGVETAQWGWCASQYVSTGGDTTNTPVDTNTPPVVAPIE